MDIEKCWIWPGRRRKEDGRAMVGSGYAYRMVYEAASSQPCPEGVAHHKCEEPGCVNPWHLEFITQGGHITGHGLPGDWGQAAKTECPQKHPYDNENTYWYKGERLCRKCRLEAGRRHRAKSK